MPSTVAQLIESADCRHDGSAPWGTRVPERSGGIYLIATTDDPDGGAPAPTGQIDTKTVQLLLDRRPELTVDGSHPSAPSLEALLRSMWLPNESVLYIGKATSIGSRVGQYYATSIGARSPHAGGWPLKLLADLDELWVHWATSPTPKLAERKAMEAFVHNVSVATRSQLLDPDHPYPYANLEGPAGRKQHGIRGARQPRTATTEQQEPAWVRPEPSSEALHSEKMTPTDVRVTLHEEIATILRSNGNRWIATKEIAREVATRKRYVKRNGTSDVTAFQVHGRTKNYPNLFERDGTRVRLLDAD